MKAQIVIKPIGVVRNSITDKAYNGWKDTCSDIVLEEEYIPALEGLADFSHIIIMFWLSKVSTEERATRKSRPLRNADIPEMGVFAWHSSRRPNPIGMSVVELLGIQGNVVKVRGLDAIDGTPVLDLRSYVGGYYHREQTVEPGWVKTALKNTRQSAVK